MDWWGGSRGNWVADSPHHPVRIALSIVILLLIIGSFFGGAWYNEKTGSGPDQSAIDSAKRQHDRKERSLQKKIDSTQNIADLYYETAQRYRQEKDKWRVARTNSEKEYENDTARLNHLDYDSLDNLLFSRYDSVQR